MPFGGLCERFVQAAKILNMEVTTIFLGPATGKPYDFASYLNGQELADTKALRKQLNEYADQDWDLVLCHRYRAYWAVARSRLAHNFCVALAHEYDMLGRWQRRWNRKIFASKFKFAGVAPQIAEELHRVTGDTIVLPNVLDTAEARTQLLAKTDALETLGIPPGPLTVGVVGRLHYKKRPTLAIESFHEFAESNPNARLIFLGDGAEASHLASIAGPNVHFLGAVPNAARLFSAFDILLHTGNVESFGMVVLEALFAGVPVVTTSDHGPATVLEELGVYATDSTPTAYANAMRRAADVDHRQLKIAGRMRVQEKFSIEALARHLQDLLIPDN